MSVNLVPFPVYKGRGSFPVDKPQIAFIIADHLSNVSAEAIKKHSKN